MCPESKRAKRYAQCDFVDMGVLKRFMLGQVRCVGCNFAKPKSICANMKSSKPKTLEIKYKLQFITFLLILLGRNFYNMLMAYQNYSKNEALDTILEKHLKIVKNPLDCCKVP